MATHEISEFSMDQTVKIAAMDFLEFHKMFNGRSGNAAMRFRRELQKALRTYAKKFHVFDFVQEQILIKCQLIEKWCRVRFYKERVNYWQHQGVPYTSAKANARNEWEEFCAKSGY